MKRECIQLISFWACQAIRPFPLSEFADCCRLFKGTQRCQIQQCNSGADFIGPLDIHWSLSWKVCITSHKPNCSKAVEDWHIRLLSPLQDGVH